MSFAKYQRFQKQQRNRRVIVLSKEIENRLPGLASVNPLGIAASIKPQELHTVCGLLALRLDGKPLPLTDIRMIRALEKLQRTYPDLFASTDELLAEMLGHDSVASGENE